MKKTTLQKILTRGSRGALAVLAAFLMGQAAQAATFIWNDTGTDWNTATNWTPNTPPATASALFTGTNVASPNVSLTTASGTVSQLHFTGYGYTIGSDNASFKIYTPTGGNSPSGNAVYGRNTSGTNTISAPMVFTSSAGSPAINQATGGTLIINGSVEAPGATGTMNFAGGGGTVIMNGTSTTAFAAIIGANSMFEFGNKLALGNPSAGIFMGGAGQSVAVRSGAALTGGNAITPNITIYGKVGFTVAGTNDIEFSGNIFLSNTNNHALLFTNTGKTILSGAMSGNGNTWDGLTFTGNSGCDVYLTGASSVTGTTSFNYTSVSGVGKFSVNSFGMVGANSPLGKNAAIKMLGNTGNTLRYVGTGETTDKTLIIASSNGNVMTLANDGSGALNFSNPIDCTANQAKTLVLSGSNTDDNNKVASILDEVTGVTVYKTSIVKDGPGTWQLTGSSNCRGTTTIKGGKLIVSGSITGMNAGTSAIVTATSTGVLAGNGYVQPKVVIYDGGVLSPGITGAGVLTTGSGASFYDNGSFKLDLKNSAVGTAGVDWDQFAVNEKLALTNVTTSFKLTLSTIVGDASTWDPYSDHLWTSFITTGSGFTTLDLTKFTIDSTGFNGASAGQFEVKLAGNNLDLKYNAIPEPGTWAMLLSGIGMLTFWQRSRRRSS